MRSVCVFCGSSKGDDPAYAAAAAEFGRQVAASGRRLVYGGGSVGLMGILADAALAAGGKVVGVIPQTLLRREVGHPGLTEQHVVDTMHERKALMGDLADALVALPGGVGTLEEFFEVWTWALLGVHGKPCGLLNAAGYFDPLLAFIGSAVRHGFLRQEYADLVLVESDAARLLSRLEAHRAAPVAKWLDPRQT